jgi:hypothetical protein
MRPDVDTARQRWRESQGGLNPTRLVFIDETGTTTNMVRVRGRSERRERLISAIPHVHRKSTTFVAGLRQNALTAPFVIDCSAAICIGSPSFIRRPTPDAALPMAGARGRSTVSEIRISRWAVRRSDGTHRHQARRRPAPTIRVFEIKEALAVGGFWYCRT